MSKQVNTGTLIKCSFGAIPSPLNVLPINKVLTVATLAAVMTDQRPLLNIMPFGLCQSPANPAVAAAFGAPMPCMPNIVSPWLPPAIKTQIANTPAINDQAKCFCCWGGMISIQQTIQQQVEDR